MITFQRIGNSHVLIEDTVSQTTRATIPINQITVWEVSDELIGIGAPDLYFLASYDEVSPAVSNWTDFINLIKDIIWI